MPVSVADFAPLDRRQRYRYVYIHSTVLEREGHTHYLERNS